VNQHYTPRDRVIPCDRGYVSAPPNGIFHQAFV